MSACKTFSHQQVHQLLDEMLGRGLHAKRIASLADATLGVMHTASLAVCTIGHGLAMARGLNARHAVKQVDRMLSNPGIDVDQILALWLPFVIGARTSLIPVRMRETSLAPRLFYSGSSAMSVSIASHT